MGVAVHVLPQPRDGERRLHFPARLQVVRPHEQAPRVHQSAVCVSEPQNRTRRGLCVWADAADGGSPTHAHARPRLAGNNLGGLVPNIDDPTEIRFVPVHLTHTPSSHPASRATVHNPLSPSTLSLSHTHIAS